MKPDSEVTRRLTATQKAYSIVVVQAEHEPHKQSAYDRLDFSRQLHVLGQEIEVLECWLGPIGEQPAREKIGHAGPKRVEAARSALGHAQGAYSAILNEAERDEENHTMEESEGFRYRLHGLAAKIDVYQWLLDLNAHSQPTGEHLVREANNILNPPSSL